MSEKLKVDQLLDPAGATVLLRNRPDGQVAEAAFDLRGFPRIDPMLVGRSVAEAPELLTRLCGLCPVTHHLAGTRALDDLHGRRPGGYARAVRALLHHASVLDTIAPKLLFTHRELAVQLKRFGRSALAAAGCTGHFPHVAVPGGVRVAADVSLVDAAQLDVLRERAAELPRVTAPDFAGAADVWLCDAAGVWNPLGEHVAVRFDGDCEIHPVARFPQLVRESRPGRTSPRPEVFAAGDWRAYRVGPAARATRGDRFGVTDSLAGVAAAVAALDGAEPETEKPTGDDRGVGNPGPDGTARGVGLVDGPRGLLAHVFDVDATGTLTGCWVLTPTAQNEPWLAAMLTEAARTGAGEAGMERAIRAADPCLPCSSAPPGAMHVRTVTIDPDEEQE